MFKKILLIGALSACALFTAGESRADDYWQGGYSPYGAVGYYGAYSAPSYAGYQRYTSGWSYDTYIPRPTAQGYYVPSVVPYPLGQPVHVNGYYRHDGTYVSPYFRSLPRR
jgi:hypothetical protein